MRIAVFGAVLDHLVTGTYVKLTWRVSLDWHFTTSHGFGPHMWNDISSIQTRPRVATFLLRAAARQKNVSGGAMGHVVRSWVSEFLHEQPF